VCKKQYAAIIENNPYVDKLVCFESDLKATIDEIKSFQPNLVIDLHKNIRTFRIKLALLTKMYSFNKLNGQKWLMVNTKINRLPDQHIVDRYMATVSRLGVKNDDKGLDYFIAPKDEMDPFSLLSDFGNVPGDCKYLVLAIGAAHNTKKMTPEMLIHISNSLEIPVILVGGSSEYEEGNIIRKRSSNKVVNTCGKLTIGQSASLIRQSTLVITPDTGMMHIAAAFGKNIISVWGNTIPQFGMYPYLRKGEGSSVIIQKAGLKCRPCSKIGFERCPKVHFFIQTSGKSLKQDTTVSWFDGLKSSVGQ